MNFFRFAGRPGIFAEIGVRDIVASELKLIMI